MLSRFLALILLLALLAGGLYFWKAGHAGQAPKSLRAVGQEIKDTAITGGVKAAFELNRKLKPYAIEIDTTNGVVRLRGEVPRDVKQVAERVAAAVPDVRGVQNDLREKSGPEPTAGERTLSESFDDHALEVQVKLALSLNRDLKGSDIKVTAFRRGVTLSGRVSRASQRAVALEVARDTPGVAEVTDAIEAAEENLAARP